MKSAIALLLGTTIIAAPAFAQRGASTAGDTRIALADSQDIIVTANKREERIQDVALSVSAVTGRELSERQLLDLQDLQTQIPGLAITTGSSAGTKRLIIRGINTDGSGATVASTVDDVPLTFSNSLTQGSGFATDLEPYDLARVEVLKGPQGTLYGATAEGGLIKYVTRAPELGRTRAGFEVTGSQLSGADAGAAGRAYINLPLGDTVALRATGYYTYQPGWISNNLRKEEGVNYLRRYGGRFSLLFEPNEKLSVRLSAVLQRARRGGFDSVEMFGQTDPTKPDFTLVDGLNFNTYFPQPVVSDAEIYSGNITYDLGSATIQSITSYVKTGTEYTADLPIYRSVFELFFGIPDTGLPSYADSDLKKFNQEFRIASNNSNETSGLHWQIGAFYTNEKSYFETEFITTNIITGKPQSTPFAEDGNVGFNSMKSKYEEFAGYATLDYYLTPRFDIEAGVRIFHNKQVYSSVSSGALVSPVPLITGPSRSDETSATFAIAPRFRITPDIIAYARVASGYRPGGPNTPVPPPAVGEPASPPTSFKADRTVNYEAGLKGSVLDNRLSFDVAAFLIDWTDIQVAGAFQRGGVAYSATVNGGKAQSKGVEWNLAARPVPWLSLGWLGAYTDATLSDDIPLLFGKKGVQLPYVPKWTHTVSADVSVPVNDRYTLFAGVGYTYTGDRRSNFNPDAVSASFPLPSYDQWSVQGGVKFDRITVQIFGKNLGNSRGIGGYANGALLFGNLPLYATASFIRPREVGLRISADF